MNVLQLMIDEAREQARGDEQLTKLMVLAQAQLNLYLQLTEAATQIADSDILLPVCRGQLRRVLEDLQALEANSEAAL